MLGITALPELLMVVCDRTQNVRAYHLQQDYIDSYCLNNIADMHLEELALRVMFKKAIIETIFTGSGLFAF